MRTWWLLLLFVCSGGVCAFSLIEIEESMSPGLYYEKVADFKVVKEVLTIVVLIKYDLRNYKLEEAAEKLKGLKKELLGEFVRNLWWLKEDTMVYIDMEEILHKIKNSIKKQNSLIEFFHGYDIERINIEGDKHGKIRKINSSLNEEGRDLVTNFTMMNEYIRRLIEPDSRVTKKSYETFYDNMDKLKVAVEGFANELNERINNIKLAFQTVQGNFVSPLIIKEQEFNRVLTEIENKEDIVFSIKKRVASLGDLKKIITVKKGVDNGIAMVEIKIPAVANRSAQIYEMRPLMAPQFIFDTVIGSAYVKPANKYIIIERNEYFYFNEQNIDLCEKIADYYLCTDKDIVYQSRHDCEYTLLMQPRKINYQSCNVHFIPGIQTFFIKSRESEKWIFVTAEALTLQINCANNIAGETSIKGTGILSFRKDCTITADSKILRVNKDIHKSGKNIIIPKINLDMNKMSKTFLIERSQKNSYERNNNNDFPVWSVIGQSNSTLEQEKELEQVRASLMILKIITGIIVIGTAGLLIFFAILVKIVADTPNEVELELNTERAERARVFEGTPRKAVVRFL